ncbi:imidazoleglycerol-phosphate dehydratase 1, chloroplastic-like isoform X1 [Zingiber officinale]|uniref:imidazoleglycerol-phosphate dehydratase 1, chloroplastic-like isoform X1 n=1 Tax=Zingiber officinale TaxID=94328 RepID=UPI001C4BB936|nr:imidazoleglycerol-phosphate dehydratase 1, chloroplastic-like isoform X1 [Zingiber officinale]
MPLLSPNSLLSSPHIATINSVRFFPTGRSGLLNPTTLHRFYSSRLSWQASSPMATPSSQDNGGVPGVAASKSSGFIISQNGVPGSSMESFFFFFSCVILSLLNKWLAFAADRIGEIKRITKETNVHVNINLDGSGVSECSTGIPFLDHMLDQLASHGLFDVHVRATGDIHIDDHHTNEDVALAIGTALLQALGDRKGICRFGHIAVPLDEAAVEVILDLSGRPHLSCDLTIPTERVGTYDTQLVEHFFQSLVNTSGMTLHIRQLAGKNSHHIIEATFKAFARALRQAVEYDLRRGGSVPSSKGVLSRS